MILRATYEYDSDTLQFVEAELKGVVRNVYSYHIESRATSRRLHVT